MAAGWPTKVSYADGDVFSASDVNDTNGTINLIKPTAKGDLFAGSAANTYTKLAVGSDDAVLTADSTSATGLKWSSIASGKVLQVVQGQATASNSTNTSTYADTGLTATITPSKTSSKILVMTSQQFYSYKAGTSSSAGYKLLRNGTSIYTTTATYGWWYMYTGASNPECRIVESLVYLDSPASVSALVYKTQGATFNTSTITWQESAYSQIILMEIGA